MRLICQEGTGAVSQKRLNNRSCPCHSRASGNPLYRYYDDTTLEIADVGAPSPLLPSRRNASLAFALNKDIPLALKEVGDGHVIRQMIREGMGIT